MPNGASFGRRGSRSILFVACACLTIAGCVRADPPPVQIELGVSPTPATIGEARVIVTLSDVPEGESAQVSIEGTRPRSPEGNPAQRPSRWAQRSPGGDYVIPAFPLDTSGEWSLTVRVTLEDGRTADRSFPVRVVGPLEPDSGS